MKTSTSVNADPARIYCDPENEDGLEIEKIDRKVNSDLISTFGII